MLTIHQYWSLIQKVIMFLLTSLDKVNKLKNFAIWYFLSEYLKKIILINVLNIK